MKNFLLPLFLFLSGSLVVTGQIRENEFDIGIGTHFRIDLLNSYDIHPSLELRLNRHALSIGPTIGYNEDELGHGGEAVKPDGFSAMYSIRLNSLRKTFDYHLSFLFYSENYYLTYTNAVNHSVKYEEQGSNICILFTGSVNLKNGFFIIASIGAGYRFCNQKLENMTTFQTDRSNPTSAIVLGSVSLKYNIIRFPRKRENNRTF